MSEFIVVKLTGWKLVYVDRFVSLASAVIQKCKGLSSSCFMVSRMNLHRVSPLYKVAASSALFWTHTSLPRCYDSQTEIPDFNVEKREILRARGGAAAVCSVVHEMINIGRLSSECFSQDSPHTRVSSEQVWNYVKGLVFFKTTRLLFRILKAPNGKQRQLCCVTFSPPM